MQKKQYEEDAKNWSIDNKNPVIGDYYALNNYADFEYLFKDIEDLEDKIVLDFGCGPGRNLVLYGNTVKRIDGVDIADNNLTAARIFLKSEDLDLKDFTLYKCNGYDLSDIEDSKYDLVISTITFQHICVYDIRFNYLKEFYRILKPNGQISIQMGFGKNNREARDYYENFYEASATNGFYDTRVDRIEQIKNDLDKIGFTNFNYHIRPPGPGDFHENWIFFNAQKG